MKKFQFSLKALLSYREHLEQIAMQELAKAQSDVNQVTAYIEEIEEEFRKARNDLEVESEKGITSENLGMYIDYLNGLEQKKFEANEALSRLMVIVEKRRSALQTKSVEKKIIINLKDKRRSEYVNEALKSAQSDSDEMVLLSGVFGKKE
ncbi:MAG: flagellar export protein FliJ [Desulfobacteraceae bacterium]|jgi:flagellar FliJ protein